MSSRWDEVPSYWQLAVAATLKAKPSLRALVRISSKVTYPTYTRVLVLDQFYRSERLPGKLPFTGSVSVAGTTQYGNDLIICRSPRRDFPKERGDNITLG